MEQDFSDFRPSKLWKRLPAERRVAAAELFWDDEQSAEQQIEAIAAIASHMKFRTKTLFGLSPDKGEVPVDAAEHLGRDRGAGAGELPPRAAAADDGRVPRQPRHRARERSHQRRERCPSRTEKLKAAAAELAGKFPPDDVSLYFAHWCRRTPTRGARSPECVNPDA